MSEDPEATGTAISQIKASIYLTVAKIIEEELKAAGDTLTATPRFVASLVELVYLQAITLGEDLESFAQHAGRKVITPADLFMVTRRNASLTEFLRECEADMARP